MSDPKANVLARAAMAPPSFESPRNAATELLRLLAPPADSGIADIADALREGRRVTDELFDRVYPPRWRIPSRHFWTPVEVARRAAAMFAESGARAVLDVGSGAGKMCVVGALSTELSTERSTSSTKFFGVEQRQRLVDVARMAAAHLGVSERARFAQGTVDRLDLTQFDGLYFFNPFGENLFEEPDWLDRTVELSPRRYREDVAAIEGALHAMPLGARIVTYHGMGGGIPDSYDAAGMENAGTGVLRMWVKRRERALGQYLEDERGAVPFKIPSAPPNLDDTSPG